VRTYFRLLEEQEVRLTGKKPCSFKAAACV